MSEQQSGLDRIDELAAYEDGWYDGHGKAMTPASVKAAKAFLSIVGGRPGIFPNEDGYIQFEWLSDNGHATVEFNGNDDRGGEVWTFTND